MSTAAAGSCRDRWRVAAASRAKKVFAKRGLLKEFERWMRELEEELNSSPDVLQRLLREPIIVRHLGPVRRYRLWLGNVWWRLLYVIDMSECRIVFLYADKRDEETYKRFSRKLR